MISAVKHLKRSDRRNRRHNPNEATASFLAFHTALNWMTLTWRHDVVLGLVFGHPSRTAAIGALDGARGRTGESRGVIDENQPADPPRWVSELCNRLQRLAEGEPVDFADVPLALEHLTPFGRRVIGACRAIPWGRTRSYGQIAAQCGSPGAARAVGSVMANNRFPLVVPCHRVIGSAGSLGGYSGPEGIVMKRRLLSMEGTCSSGPGLIRA